MKNIELNDPDWPSKVYAVQSSHDCGFDLVTDTMSIPNNKLVAEYILNDVGVSKITVTFEILHKTRR